MIIIFSAFKLTKRMISIGYILLIISVIVSCIIGIDLRINLAFILIYSFLIAIIKDTKAK